MASLTEAQRRAVDSASAALCIIAGAGSGKTRVLTLRAARRIREATADADHTVICTFTRKAAHELRHRLRRYGVTVSTAGRRRRGARARASGPAPSTNWPSTLLRRQALDTGQSPAGGGRAPVPDASPASSGTRPLASAVDTEIGWAKANCLAPDRTPTWPPSNRPSGRSPPSTRWSRPSRPTRPP